MASKRLLRDSWGTLGKQVGKRLGRRARAQGGLMVSTSVVVFDPIYIYERCKFDRGVWLHWLPSRSFTIGVPFIRMLFLLGTG